MEQQQQQSTPNRRQRRMMLKEQGIIRAISKMPFLGEVRSKIRQENIAYGKKIHAENTRRIEERNATRLEAALDSAKASWKELGYNDAEITLLEEAWVATAVKEKDRAENRANKKLAKKLRAEANQLRADRNK